jgi:DNA topoisomerase VI subunit A
LLQSDAEFILLVEKEAAFMRIAEDRFYNKYPCIVITAKGQPDVATRCVGALNYKKLIHVVTHTQLVS